MFQTIFLPHQHGRSALDTSRTLFLLASTQGVSCRLVMNHLIYMYMFSLIPPPPPPPPPHIYVSKCMYVYVHISLFLPECACTTIIDISPRIFKLILLLCINHNCYLYMPSWGPNLVNKLISISIDVCLYLCMHIYLLMLHLVPELN